ncbi:MULTISPECIES: LON peptidase substrate-binding domain-containing protein [Rhizobium/Agrobacterium group]|uniref:LON peptidase substrate-binding domain-containing protein n=1 Tax=Rhizobium/Agrobacterium group TaxID=227290 RepID=UPI001ADCF624|nr:MULTISPECIES: LON peptidase substrate-binding domain-containing protein [Rhizobium/Agrobacterium group]MBO9111933.1 LON peptidase substrate-binding domain-containing protein [Agrobacterium sp. S2/73]QXZ76294.1 LON peptidase substrate-binding domain-containing protein [Agrobacterium sp. S7/73]QYA17160.1 LON peptidase substrate-binding domain-containing protein [Rhizobium sp. AB2/73]UEQ85267.1 LON peptidase substrate-binding domain-containing protein [Rhizobium sp. AB2/73]
MRDFRDAKAMAKTLREALSAKSLALSTSESQELVARILGFRDWNVLAARIQSTEIPATSAQANTRISADAKIPVVPMRDMVLFPHMVSRIFVARDKTRQAVEQALAGDRRVLVVAQRSGTYDRPSTADALHSVGVMANVVDRQTQVDGALKVTVCGLQRAGIVGIIDGEFLEAKVKAVGEQGAQSKEAADLSSAVLDAYQSYAEVDFSALPPGSKARFSLPSVGDASQLADTVATLLSAGIEQKQQLLETSDVVERLKRLIEMMGSGRPKAVA